MNEDLKGTMFDTTFDEYARWSVFFDGLWVRPDSLVAVDDLPYIYYSHEASEILRDVPRKDLLSIASRRKGYG